MSKDGSTQESFHLHELLLDYLKASCSATADKASSVRSRIEKKAEARPYTIMLEHRANLAIAQVSVPKDCYKRDSSDPE